MGPTSSTWEEQKETGIWSNQVTYHFFLDINYSAGIYLFRVNNGNTITMYKICSKLTAKTLDRCHWHRSDVFIVNLEHGAPKVDFEQANAGLTVFIRWLGSFIHQEVLLSRKSHLELIVTFFIFVSVSSHKHLQYTGTLIGWYLHRTHVYRQSILK